MAKRIFEFQFKSLAVLILAMFLFGCSSGAHVITGRQMPELSSAKLGWLCFYGRKV